MILAYSLKHQGHAAWIFTGFGFKRLTEYFSNKDAARKAATHDHRH